jgi:cytochrome c oxidase cbb3-type subunit IV
MRLARSVLDNATGLDIYAIIGLVIFFSFFIGLIFWVVNLKKSNVEDYSRLPLTEDENGNAAMAENERI